MSDPFDEAFLESLPQDTAGACIAICRQAIAFYRTRAADIGKRTLSDDHDTYLHGLALLEAYTARHPHDYDEPAPKVSKSAAENSRAILTYMDRLRGFMQQKLTEEQFDTLRTRYSALLDRGMSHYHFDEHALRRIRRDIHLVREVLKDKTDLSEDQRRHMVARLSKLETELNHPDTDLDRFWGLIGEASLCAAKLGANGDLIVNGIRRILSIVWEAQCEAAGVPPNTPLIGIVKDPDNAPSVRLIK
jgi:hypothetical protein